MSLKTSGIMVNKTGFDILIIKTTFNFYLFLKNFAETFKHIATTKV